VDGKLASTSKTCVWDAFNNPRQRKLSPKKASELTFKKPKQEKPDIQSTNLTQDEHVLCFNEDSFRQSLEMCQPSAGWLLNFAEEKDIEQPVRKHIYIDQCCHDAVNLRSMTQCFEIERTFIGCEVPRKDDCRSGGKRDLGGGETYTTYHIKVW